MDTKEPTEQFDYTLLRISKYADYHYGDFTAALRGLGAVLSEADHHDAETLTDLGSALAIIADEITHAVHDVDRDIVNKVEKSLAQPDSREEIVAKALRPLGYTLCVDALSPDRFTVINDSGG